MARSPWGSFAAAVCLGLACAGPAAAAPADDAVTLPAGTSAPEAAVTGRSHPYILARIVRLPQIDSFTAPNQPDRAGALMFTLTGWNLELIDKLGWDAANGSAVDGMPVPIPGQGQKETLSVHLPNPPQTAAMLLLWLRGEDKPRATTVTAPASVRPAMPAPPVLNNTMQPGAPTAGA